MSDVEVIEIGQPRYTVLAYETPDPLAAAVLVSVTTTSGGGPPIIATALDDLTDVEAPHADLPATPAVLARGPDGVYRPMPLEQVNPQRGSIVHYVDRTPDALPAELAAGDFLTVLAGRDAGTVYEVRED